MGKTLLAAVGIALVYRWVYVNLVGVAAAIPFSTDFFSLFDNNATVSLLVVMLLTTVPAALLSAMVGAFLIVSLLPRGQFRWALAMVVVITLCEMLRVTLKWDLQMAISGYLMPDFVGYVPAWLAWWCSLPLSVVLLKRFGLGAVAAAHHSE